MKLGRLVACTLAWLASARTLKPLSLARWEHSNRLFPASQARAMQGKRTTRCAAAGREMAGAMARLRKNDKRNWGHLPPSMKWYGSGMGCGKKYSGSQGDLPMEPPDAALCGRELGCQASFTDKSSLTIEDGLLHPCKTFVLCPGPWCTSTS